MVSRELTKKYEEHIGNNIDEVLNFFEDKDIIGEITIVIKGNRKKRDLDINLSDLKQDLHNLINAGLSLSAASKYLAKKNGIKKRLIYDLK